MCFKGSKQHKNYLTFIFSCSPSSSAKIEIENALVIVIVPKKTQLMGYGFVNRTFKRPNLTPCTGAHFLNGITGQIQYAIIRENYSDNTFPNK